MSTTPATHRSAGARPRVLHFVTGGFSGATQVAVDLALAHLASGRFTPKLVLRRKRNTEAARVDALRARGLDVEVVPGWAHAATVAELVRVCRQWQPDILVAHGYSEHLWGRYAGLIAKVPCLVHVEHNSRERYTRWRLAQARWLAQRTAAIIGVSEGVRQSLLAHGFPAGKTHAISNGIQVAPFEAPPPPLAERVPGIVMAARFARQKDHASLLRALAVLRERGLTPPLQLAGAGKERLQNAARRLSEQLGLQEQVRFLGLCKDVPGLLRSHQVCVLSTHYEGMPLSLIEGMAAGCVVVGSRVVGVQEVLRHGDNGLLAGHADPVSLADALQAALCDAAQAQRMADAARAEALERYSQARMTADYENLFESLLRQGVQAR